MTDKKIDANLDVLIQEIGKGNVVPIVGIDLIKVKLPTQEKPMDLMEYVLLKLEEKYKESREIHFAYPVDVESATEKINYIHAYATREKLSFYTYIKDIMREAEPLCLNTSFDQLAKIRRFKLLVNASFSTLMEKTVEKNRKIISNKMDVFNLNITDTPLQDIEIEASLNTLSPVESPKKLKKTVVYNLYGRYEWGNSFVVADDDVLELVHTISSNKDKLKTLYELLSSSSLLFIGCNFPDWLLRFFIRIFSKQKLSVSSSLYSVADILVDRNRAIFISNSTIKYFDSDGSKFLELLSTKINQAEPSWIRNSEDANYIFLSYATDNQSKVVEIYEKLDDHDLDIFMDIRAIDYGDDITQEVKKAIDGCKIFIPVISNETNTSIATNRFFSKEWEYILDEHQRRNPQNDIAKSPVILPVFLNAIKENELKAGTPKRFFELKYQGASSENGISSAFITKVKDILKN